MNTKHENIELVINDSLVVTQIVNVTQKVNVYFGSVLTRKSGE